MAAPAANAAQHVEVAAYTNSAGVLPTTPCAENYRDRAYDNGPGVRLPRNLAFSLVKR